MASHAGKFRLTKLNLDEISLVAAGDDPMARTVLSKAMPDGKDVAGTCEHKRKTRGGRCKDCGGYGVMKEEANELSGEFRRTDLMKRAVANPKSSPLEISGHHGHRPHGKSILWPALYEHLRRKGKSKAAAAAISNSAWKKKHMGIATNTPTSARGAL